jgi:cysteinyl-tRNA synthetase
VTVRAAGTSARFDAGTTVAVDDLRPGSSPATAASAPGWPAGAAPERPAAVGLAATAERLRADFDGAVAARDPDAAVVALLELEQAIVDWSADTLQSDEAGRARAELRRMVVRLGELAAVGARDPREVVAPFVGAVLEGRVAAREAKQYDLADRLRDALVAAGVEVRDGPSGTEWLLADGS